MILLVLPDASNDSTLLRAARRGDKSAVGKIYNAYLEPIYQFTRMRVSNSQTAEDITSNVFFKLIDGLDRGKGPRQNLRAWLFRVARSEIVDHYGTRNREVPMDIREMRFMDPNAPDPAADMLKSADRQQLGHALASLRPDYQEVILLRFDQELTLQETADIMGRKLNTVKTLQLRAVKRLRDLLAQGHITAEVRYE